MSLEALKQTDASSLPISKLIIMIARGQTTYLNHKLNDWGINSTQLHLLFEISHQNDLNQEKISTRCNINKGAAARSIRKLEEKGLVTRKIDDDNRRQNKVSLTEEGQKTLDASIHYLKTFEEEVFSGDIIEKSEMQKALKDMVIRTIELNQREE